MFRRPRPYFLPSKYLFSFRGCTRRNNKNNAVISVFYVCLFVTFLARCTIFLYVPLRCSPRAFLPVPLCFASRSPLYFPPCIWLCSLWFPCVISMFLDLYLRLLDLCRPCAFSFLRVPNLVTQSLNLELILRHLTLSDSNLVLAGSPAVHTGFRRDPHLTPTLFVIFGFFMCLPVR